MADGFLGWTRPLPAWPVVPDTMLFSILPKLFAYSSLCLVSTAAWSELQQQFQIIKLLPLQGLTRACPRAGRPRATPRTPRHDKGEKNIAPCLAAALQQQHACVWCVCLLPCSGVRERAARGAFFELFSRRLAACAAARGQGRRRSSSNKDKIKKVRRCVVDARAENKTRSQPPELS
jgi:hypothetical protein